MRGNSKTCSLTAVQLIERHFLDLQHATSISGATFATTVREHYEANYPVHARSIEWSQVSDLFTRSTRDYEKFKRWFNADVKARFPLEIMESVIAAFPADRRFRLQIELASRQGMLAIPMPSGNASDDGLFLGKMAKETGEAMIAISQLMDDGVIDSKDKTKAEQAVKELDEAIAVIAAMKSQIERKALGKEQCMVDGKDVLHTYRADPTQVD
jgi:hypothetical protein